MKFQKWSKRDPVKNYFPVPNEVFLLKLLPGELAVYSRSVTVRRTCSTEHGRWSKLPYAHPFFGFLFSFRLMLRRSAAA
jgi:hypothetical protein